MPPFTGRGANLAMLDAVELANALTSGCHANMRAALSAFETVMLARMESAITETLASQNLMFAADAPAGLVAMMRAKQQENASRGAKLKTFAALATGRKSSL